MLQPLHDSTLAVPLSTNPSGPSASARPAPNRSQLRQRRMHRRIILGRILFAAACLLAWEITSRWLLDPFWIGQPSKVAERLWVMLKNGDLWWHASPTITQAVSGLLLSLVVGVPIGLLFAFNKYFENIIEPFFLGLYSIPRIALAPLFILWFGIGSMSKIIMAFSLVIFVVILNTYEGVRSVDRDLIDMMRAMRASRGYILRKVILPAIVPWIFASIRVGVGLALIGSVVGEMLGSNRGLGWLVEHSASRIDVTGVFAGLVILMMLGMLLNEVAKFVEHRLLRGRY